jgi:hypothetical protein
MHDLVGSPRACEKLLGKMVGLPAEGGDTMTPQTASLAPVGGRWAIRSCEAHSDGDAISLRLGGIGWQWVDKEENGFRLQQYVFFAATVEFRGQLDVAYDPRSHIASVWVTPVDAANAQVEALGNINVHPDGITAHLFGLGLRPFGMSVDNIARARAGIVGAQRFRDRLTQGMTATYDTRTQQLDMVAGQLPNGVTPARPYTTDLPWVVNERVLAMPGGLQVMGPFDPGPEPAFLSVRAEQGAGLSYRAICESDVWEGLDSAARGAPLAGPSAAAARIQAGYNAEIPIVRPPCRWVLAVSSLDSSPAVAALLLRVAGPSTQGASAGAWVSLTLLEFDFGPTKPNGTPWDVGGGAPDPEFVVLGGGRRVLLCAKLQDQFRGKPMTSSAPVSVSATSPLAVEVFDKDIASDDPMGTAALDLSRLSAGGELTAPVMMDGVQTGSMRLRADVRPGQ